MSLAMCNFLLEVHVFSCTFSRVLEGLKPFQMFILGAALTYKKQTTQRVFISAEGPSESQE